jgi:hypothetical protein
MRTGGAAALLWAVLAWVAIGKATERVESASYVHARMPRTCFFSPSFSPSPLSSLSPSPRTRASSPHSIHAYAHTRDPSALNAHKPHPHPSPSLPSRPPRVRLFIPKTGALPALVGRHRVVHASKVPALWATGAAGAVLWAQAAVQLGAAVMKLG